jgi:hypothetical protein
MATYVYETIPEKPGDPVKRYELWQQMREPAYERHPETGERIRRVIIGGVGMPGSISDASADRPKLPKSPPDSLADAKP